MNAKKIACLTGVAWLALAAAARAEETPPAAGAAAAAPAAPAGPTALSTPAMSASLSANADPISWDAGPLGKIYLSGQVTGIAFGQDNPFPGDKKRITDVTNAQIEIQKTDGVFQFFVEAGAYSLPSLGAFYFKSGNFAKNTYDYVPVAYIKLAPTSDFSVQIGKLPTLIGSEYIFSFQNLNVMRGLLWNQEPVVSRGVQVNYTKGPVAINVSWNDGFYSNKYDSGSALITYTISPTDTIAVAGSANFHHSSVSGFATPIAQNNGDVFNLIWTHTQGAWMISPYFQYTKTPKITSYGLPTSASTTGAAVLAKYTVNPTFNVAGRAEVIDSSGSGVSLLYGPKSKAYSLTITPTWQIKTFFIRAELAYTKLDSASNGSAFGVRGNTDSQTRAIVETGVLF